MEDSYEGFDVVQPAVEWCQAEITPRHPNFRFQAANIQNGKYNPSGAESAAEYRWPYEDGALISCSSPAS